MNARPITEKCSRTYGRRAHACFGISPFNGYFTEAKIRELAEWGRDQFASMHFFVPDLPSAYTLEALGHDPDSAARKARKQTQYLLNKIHRALKSTGLSDVEAWGKVLAWDALERNEEYQRIFGEVSRHFEEDSRFQAACIEASRWVLEKRVPDESLITEASLRSAVRYLLAEIPLFVDSAGIVGADSSVFCYHQCIEFLERLFRAEFPVRPSENQGFLVVDGEIGIDSHLEQGLHQVQIF